MVEAAMDVYKDTEIKPMIWHDSLSLFMATDNMDWMATQHTSDGRTWRDLFILPEAGLNDGLQYYRNRLPGNSPDLMNWDNSLNKDVIDVIDWHVIATTTLDDNNNRKFSLATPKTIQKAVFRLMNPNSDVGVLVPTNRRIIQDTNKVMFALKAIVEAEGIVVPGLSHRTGKRGQLDENRSQKRGGSRVYSYKQRGMYSRVLHGDAASARRERVLESADFVRRTRSEQNVSQETE